MSMTCPSEAFNVKLMLPTNISLKSSIIVESVPDEGTSMVVVRVFPFRILLCMAFTGIPLTFSICREIEYIYSSRKTYFSSTILTGKPQSSRSEMSIPLNMPWLESVALDEPS